MTLSELLAHLNSVLEPSRFKDYCPNGLQVEGRMQVRRVLCGVTASQALLDLAVAEGFDALFVHHGYFWRGEDGRITGVRKHRLATLLKHDISLIAYHLPLDAHPQLGNNAQLGRLLGWHAEGRFGEQDLGWIGDLPEPSTLAEVVECVATRLGRTPQVFGAPDQKVSRVAWCSGGAQGYFEDAIVAGADLFLTGEVSEPTFHLARESGAAFVAAGHHATERYGPRAIAAHLSEHCGLEAVFVDLENPV